MSLITFEQSQLSDLLDQTSQSNTLLCHTNRARVLLLLDLFYPHMHDAVKRIIFHAKEKFILLDKKWNGGDFIIFIVITITVTIVNH